MDKKEKIKRSIIIIIIMTIACVSIINSRERRIRKMKEKEEQKEEVLEVSGSYNVDIIKMTNALSKNKNYLISPYSIEVALNMLREGADGNTKDEIDKVIGNRKINDVTIKDKLNIANAIFIKNMYQNDVKNDFVNNLKNNYQAEVLYDEFIAPTVINNWVKNKTNGMIEKILEEMNGDFVMGLANALALDVEWKNSFECNLTKSGEFHNIDSKTEYIEMMHQTYKNNARYFKNDDVEGVVLPYKNDDNNELEFVGILPGNGVSDYISNLTSEKLNNLFSNEKTASDKYRINLSLPRFTYDYEVKDFIRVLQNMGIKDAFNPELANFKKMIEIDENVYVGEAIHKTRIELNEKGTKAAAVTYFGMVKNSMAIDKDYEEVDIVFDKPFIYMIREKNTGEILFFGTVFEPNKWNGTTCNNE